ncbi:MAG: M12 family metallo-peptidase [Candidatus Symbiothrix sp.]|jgi:hypothetical protein|nr:M12 family metallo-peptidase [Candidatus Symbiothrix sp.]
MKKTLFLITLTLACAWQMQAQFLIGSPAKTQLRSTDAACLVSTEWADAKAVHGDMFVRAGVVELNRTNVNDPSIQNALLTRDLLTIQLFADVTVTANKTGVRTTTSGGIYWTGNVSNGELTLFMQNNCLSGTLRQGNQVFDITSDETGNVKVVELNTEKNPMPAEDCFFNEDDTVGTNGIHPDETVAQSEWRAAADFPTPSTDVDGNYIVDILVLYPNEVAALMGATPELRTAKVDYYIEQANEIFINSRINVRFRLAHDEINNAIPKGATTTSEVSGTPRVTALRDLYGADIISHWNFNGAAGIGSVFSGTGRSAMYNSSKYSDVISRYTFVHECGHNMGGQHDRYEYSKPGGEQKHLTQAPGDNFGKSFPGYHTIMSYGNDPTISGGSSTRVKYFSNPDVIFNGQPTGIALIPGAPLTAEGNGGPADNARYINIESQYVSAYNDPITTIPSFNVTVINGQSNISNAVANTVIELTADTPQEGQVFSHWLGGNGVFGDPDQANTTYVMASENVTLTAIFKIPSTEENPWLIANRADLEKIIDFPGEIYKLTADIDMAGKTWTPIPSFSGKLYGEGHKLNNATIASSANYVGLFAELATGAYVKGVNMVGGNVIATSAGAYVGAITGYISGDNVTITECGNTANIRGTGATARVGGLVGSIKGNFATITSSFNKGNVTGGLYAGGIVGRPADAQNTVTIRDCYSQSTITTSITTTSSSYLGGIVGYMYNGGSGQYTVENCYATGTVVNAASAIGSAVGIVGRAWNSSNSIVQHNVALQTNLQGSTSNTVAILGSNLSSGTKENFSNSEMLLNGVQITYPDPINEKNGAAVTLVDAKTAAWYAANLPSWNFTNTWAITDGSLPILKWETTGDVAIESPKVIYTLRASASNGILTVKGLVTGESVRVYTVTGQTVANQMAKNSEQTIQLPAYGVYIVVAGNKAVKVFAGK